MAKVIMVPGLAVRTYARPAAEALGRAHDVELLPAPAWRGVPDRVTDYGDWLAAKVRASAEPVDLLIGMSLGTQAAAVAAAGCDVRRLMLISPTVEPAKRSRPKLMRSWLQGDHHPDSQAMWEQVPDWSRAGPRRIYRGMVSALNAPLESILAEVDAAQTIVHAGWDNLTSYAFAAQLAAVHHGDLLELPAAPHSWPIGDTEGFLQLIEAVLGGRRTDRTPTT